jgi:hypothetical protein
VHLSLSRAAPLRSKSVLGGGLSAGGGGGGGGDSSGSSGISSSDVMFACTRRVRLVRGEGRGVST